AELVTADPAEDILSAEARADGPRHLDQQGVARRVTGGVVDELEAVEIEVEQKVPASGKPGVGDELGNMLEEPAPVGQARQRVVAGLVGDVPLEAVLGGDVAGHAAVAGESAFIVEKRRRLDVNAGFARIGANERRFELVRFARVAPGEVFLPGG